MSRSNFYFSMLVMFIAGALAMWLIIRIATKVGSPTVVGGTEASYKQLEKSILNN